MFLAEQKYERKKGSCALIFNWRGTQFIEHFSCYNRVAERVETLEPCCFLNMVMINSKGDIFEVFRTSLEAKLAQRADDLRSTIDSHNTIVEGLRDELDRVIGELHGNDDD